jgi:hypothetical protein
MAQRAIVLQLLRDDHPKLWSRTELEREAVGVYAQVFVDALATLAVNGVVDLDPEQVQASPCAWHLDALGMVAI